MFVPGEIAKKIKGVSTRMLTDLAEKGIVIPVKESTGAGSPRLYDEDNLLQIMFAVALRGMFSRNNMLELMKKLDENAKKPVHFMILTYFNRTRIFERIHVDFVYEGETISMEQLSATANPQTDVDRFISAQSIKIDLAGMKKFIAKNF